MSALGKTTREKQRFFIGSENTPTQEIWGVQSIRCGFQNPQTALKFIGMEEGSLIPAGPRIGEFEVNQFLITDDFFYQYTGQNAMSGYLVRSKTDNERNFSFQSGYLTSYSVKCSVGTIPEIQASIRAFGKVGNFPTDEIPAEVETAASEVDLKIADPGSISINIDDFNSNRVTSFELSIGCPRNPIYHLGSFDPAEVETNYPFPVNLSFQVEVADYNYDLNDRYPCTKQAQDVNLTIKDLETQADLLTFNFQNMEKVGESVLSEASNMVALSITYRGFINR